MTGQSESQFLNATIQLKQTTIHGIPLYRRQFLIEFNNWQQNTFNFIMASRMRRRKWMEREREREKEWKKKNNNNTKIIE